jgi:hypothetical protein
MQELEFIGMKPKTVSKEADPQHIQKKTANWRKLQQTQNRSELDRDVATLKQKVQETEGQDMRETIQNKINAWFVENRNPETGEYPDFPATDEGGCAMTPSRLGPRTVDIASTCACHDESGPSHEGAKNVYVFRGRAADVQRSSGVPSAGPRSF